MKRKSPIVFFCTLMAFAQFIARAQSVPPFDMDAYKAYIATHMDMNSAQLLALHPAGVFRNNAPTEFSGARYFLAIDSVYKLTPDEKTLLGRNGFVVTERLRPTTFAAGFMTIYNADLPVFISTDAILHAVHISYDRILEQIEKTMMIPTLGSVLTQVHAQLPAVVSKYSNTVGMTPSLTDVDLYLTVARKLLGQNVTPVYPSTVAASNEILTKISAAQWEKGMPLFADSERLVDYSQFTVRGHYTDSQELANYFQSMIWLGRTEFYLHPPENTAEMYSESQIQRQTIAALLMREALMLSGAKSDLDRMDDLLRFFVGDADNVTLNHLSGLITEVGMVGADEMLDTLKFRSFQSTLLQHAWAYQRILSQMLVSGSFLATDHIQPASAFLLFGQRFVIDSYVTGSVVFDKIVYKNQQVRRMLPSTQDVLFAIGNDASGQLLVPELDAYHYATNLAAARYLVDAYEPAFWRSTIYNGWLNAVRSLNPPLERSDLPPFMQTAAWWQEKMNTQLASWAELRHDNLLYAKQSYTGIPACSFPCGYVEPIPAIFRGLAALADTAASYFGHLTMPNASDVPAYFVNMKGTMDTLTSVAEKELAGVELSQSEKGFLARTVFPGGCGSGRNGFVRGWYGDLCYGEAPPTIDGQNEVDIVVADVHTSPADAAGNMVGWVLHGGTGPLNMAFLITEVPEVGSVAFAGPVMSYYEYVTVNFKRLTDEEWKAQYAGMIASRPSWANLYLADESGMLKEAGQTLLTGVENDEGRCRVPGVAYLAQNYPNPFNPMTTIRFELPASSAVSLKLFDVLGREVRTLIERDVPAGAYNVRLDASGLSSGVYFYTLRARPISGALGPEFVQTKKLILVR